MYLIIASECGDKKNNILNCCQVERFIDRSGDMAFLPLLMDGIDHQ